MEDDDALDKADEPDGDTEADGFHDSDDRRSPHSGMRASAPRALTNSANSANSANSRTGGKKV